MGLCLRRRVRWDVGASAWRRPVRLAWWGICCGRGQTGVGLVSGRKVLDPLTW